jgi:hypothetical protein
MRLVVNLCLNAFCIRNVESMCEFLCNELLIECSLGYSEWNFSYIGKYRVGFSMISMANTHSAGFKVMRNVTLAESSRSYENVIKSFDWLSI